MIRRLVWIGVVLLYAACAIPEPPPGGPEDKRPPQVESTYPDSASAGVARDTEIRIAFDENMRKTRLERLVNFHPGAVMKDARWKGNEVTIVLEEPLHADTTYVVQLKPGFSDAHGVRNQQGFRFAFATSAAIDSGVITGRVLFRRKPSNKGLVRLFVLPKDTSFSVEAARPDREVGCGADGGFRFDFLPTDGASFLLWAFQDKNANLNYERDGEAAAEGDTVKLNLTVPRVEGVDIYITDPKEPAAVRGTIDNRTGVDSIPVVITMHELSDTVPPTYYTRSARDGSFRLSVLQGTYVLRAFLDFRNDSLCGDYPCAGDSSRACVEPCVIHPDTFHIKPGDKVAVGALILGESVEDER